MIRPLDIARHVVPRMLVIVVVGLAIAAFFTVRENITAVIITLLAMFVALVLASLVLPRSFTGGESDRPE